MINKYKKDVKKVAWNADAIKNLNPTPGDFGKSHFVEYKVDVTKDDHKWGLHIRVMQSGGIYFCLWVGPERFHFITDLYFLWNIPCHYYFINENK